MAEAAYNASVAENNHGYKIGYGAASNAGRMVGSLGHPEGSGELKDSFATQEEDIVSNWLTSEPLIMQRDSSENLYRKLLHGRWGLIRPTGLATDH